MIVQQPTLRPRRRRNRRWRLLTRTLPLVIVLLALAGGAFAFGAYEAGSTGRSERALVRDYLSDWVQARPAAMYRLLSPGDRGVITEQSFAAALAHDADVATETSLHFARHITIHNDVASVAVAIHTGTWGVLQETLILHVAPDDHEHLQYRPAMLFPGLREGEKLTRSSQMGARGTLLADDGEVLAQGPDRSSPIPTVAAPIVGSLGPIPADEKAYYQSLGYPAGTQVGLNGLELIFQKQLGGTPGGTLHAGTRTLAVAAAKAGQTVRTTINPKLEQAVFDEIGQDYAGMTVLNEKTGAVEAAVGEAFTDLQPPGSTFKIITAAAALSGHVATPDTNYGYATQANIGGYIMENSAGESCGGTLADAFASSCDSVFGPLGIKVGPKRLVATAEKFGFNRSPHIPTALSASIPSAAEIGGDTAVGMTAIGQGQLEATTLEMADVGQAIANHGRRAIPTFLAGATPHYVHVTSPQVASEIQQMMIDVVNTSGGTGTSAAISGYEVAGKTGTAELADTGGQQNDVKNTDAWFVGYVPNSKSDIVACALFPANGYGADSAAPAVRSILEVALGLE